MMFELNTSGEVYVWHRLFLLLSMERTTAFLLDLKFPALEHIEVFRDASRDFVRQFCDFERQPTGRDSFIRRSQQLYDATYAALVARIGADVVVVFCEWGNQLAREADLQRQLSAIWDTTLFWLLRERSGLMAQLQDVLQQKALMIKAVILRYDREIAGILDAIDVVETIPKDDWDQEAYRIYNWADRADLADVEIVVSPMDTLYSHISDFKIRTAWRQIKLVLTDAEFEAFAGWVAGQQYLKPRNRMSIFGSISASELAALLQQIAEGGGSK